MGDQTKEKAEKSLFLKIAEQVTSGGIRVITNKEKPVPETQEK